MAQMIWLDMDGTIADLYQGEWLTDILNENTRPYINAARLVEEEDLLNLEAQGYTLGIISWLARGSSQEYDRAVRKAKREWLKANYPNINFIIHIVKYGYPKHYIKGVHGSILIDDEEPNRKAWIGKAYAPNEYF